MAKAQQELSDLRALRREIDTMRRRIMEHPARKWAWGYGACGVVLGFCEVFLHSIDSRIKTRLAELDR